MKHSAFPFLFLSFFLLFSCQSEESALQPVTDVRELSFRVINYVQYGFEDITRAQSVTKLFYCNYRNITSGFVHHTVCCGGSYTGYIC